jgi:hypothetical protein
MNDLFETARQLQFFCDTHGWSSCFIGGIAVLRWGEARITRDVDLTLLTGFGGEERFVDVLLAKYPARIADAREFALRNRVLLLRTGDDVGIDISLGGLHFERLMVTRASDFNFGEGPSIRTCSAEDLLVMKLFASRPIDVRDAESVAIRQGNRLDWRYVEDQLAPLIEVKGESQIAANLARLRKL